jgi:transcriptional regulator with XRE-family HTH domain
MVASGLTLKDVANATGLSRATIRKWYQEDGRYLTSISLAAVARFLGVDDATALALAGGITGEQEMARTGRENIATGRPAPGTARFRRARKKAGAAIRGRTHGPEWNARTRAGLIAAGAPAYGAAALRAFMATPDGAARHRLWIRLRWHPHPTRDEVRAWAAEIAARLGRPDAEILEAWKPALTKRGIWALGGRPPAERRHYLVAALVERWPAGTHGSWAMIAWWVGKSEGKPIEPTDVARWWWSHRQHCTSSATLSRPDAWTRAVDRVPTLPRHEARRLVSDAERQFDAAYAQFFAPYLRRETRMK